MSIESPRSLSGTVDTQPQKRSLKRRDFLELGAAGAIVCSLGALLRGVLQRQDENQDDSLRHLTPGFLYDFRDSPRARLPDPVAAVEYQQKQFEQNRTALAKYRFLNDRSDELYCFFEDHGHLLIPSMYSMSDPFEDIRGEPCYARPVLADPSPEVRRKVRDDHLAFGILHTPPDESHGSISVYYDVMDGILECSEFLSEDWRAILLFTALGRFKDVLETRPLSRPSGWVDALSDTDEETSREMVVSVASDVLRSWRPQSWQSCIAKVWPLVKSLAQEPPYDENDLCYTRRARQINEALAGHFDLPLIAAEQELTGTQIREEAYHRLFEVIFLEGSRQDGMSFAKACENFGHLKGPLAVFCT